MKYIGIRGHRGAGKKSIAWLLGNTIEFLSSNKKDLIDSEIFDRCYEVWCSQIMSDPDITDSAQFKYVYLDSFSDSIMVFVHLLLGIPSEYLYKDSDKDNIIINFKDFSWKHKNEYDEIELTSSDEMYKNINKNSIPQAITKNIYMTLREFIMYFGLEVMQRFFGRNVWVKTLNSNSKDWENFYDTGNNYRIFMDLKTSVEISYIIQQGGKVINVTRPVHKKGKSGLDKLDQNDYVDYNIEVNGDLMSIKDQIKYIAQNITNDKHDEL